MVLLVATGGLVLGTELCLWWLLRAFSWRAFWPVTVTGGAAFGAGLAWAGDHALGSWVVAGAALGAALGALFRFVVKGRHRLAFMLIAPAFLVICLLIVYPFFFQLRLAFGNLNLYTIGRWLQDGELGWVGFENFRRLFSHPTAEGAWESFLRADFWVLLGRTFLWTGINLVFHVGFGLGLAMLLNRDIRGKGLYRTLLILPWAMPQVVAILAWRGEFHPQFGLINQVLSHVGLDPVNWWSDPVPIFVSCCLVNIWLGIPFMMIVFLGGLGSIPKSYYEAASIDGASRWRQFCEITVPMLKPVVVPSVTLGTIWTFNNINVIYLMTGQDGGNEYADILVSALYKSAFTYSRFSYSAAFAVVIFMILAVITVGWMKVSRGTESAVGA